MKKRCLSILLCLCLALSFIPAVPFVAAKAATNDYVLFRLDHHFSINLTTGSGTVFAQCEDRFDPFDLTAYDFKTDPARVALQMDIYMSGDAKFQSYMGGGRLNGQLEITSSGGCDSEELSARPGAVLPFEQDTWKRILIPLSAFTGTFGGEFDPSAFNYFRMYLYDDASGSYSGGTGSLKLCNMMFVDTAVPEAERPTALDMPIGDGTFRAAPPVYHKVAITEGYGDGTAVFAGYNLQEYLAAHPEITPVDSYGQTDYSGVVNSLLDGLSAAGGGTLFIPAGTWEFRRELRLPYGTAIYGEWANPDENVGALGTVLAVYCGKGEENGTPFITMGKHCVVQNVSFWYPEQSAFEPVAYPPTIDLSEHTFARNVTLYNSYFGIQSKRMSGCPNAWGVWGTPLNIGVDFDLVVDIARIEELHFAPDYWINSGLPGAPVTDDAITALEDLLYNYAIGITLRRIDWSYLTFSDVKGYNIGLMFDESTDGSWPNGQCVGLTFTDCKYGHFIHGSTDSGESLTDITMKNCEYGVYLANNDKGHGMVQYYNASIQATKYAVYQDSLVKFSLMASTVRGGSVVSENGNNIFINNRFMTAAPQIKLSHGTVSAVLLGNTDACGDAIRYENPGLCTVSYDAAKVDVQPYQPLTREEAATRPVGPSSENYVIPTDLDNSGRADVTEALQAHLTAMGETGGTVFVTPGKYRINGTLYVPSGVELRGSGDYASIPKALNTIFEIYTPVETGKDSLTSTATVTLAPNSGMRGVIFNYPKQNSTYRVINDRVYDPVASKEQGADVYVKYYEFDFVPYPFTVRGTGENVYLKYVTVRNGWNGVDFRTNRCDGHFIDHLAGHFFNRGIVVGGGSTGGFIRNFQFNYNAIFAPSGDTWSGFGGEPSTGELQAAFHQPMQAQFNNNMIALQLGNVNDQVVYDCFNYASYIGVHLVEENGEAANARIYGHGVDYGTVSLKAEAAENVHFVNLQLTAFNQSGSDSNTGRYAVDQSVNPIYDIWVTDTFRGELNVTNFTEWAPAPNAGVRVDGGTLNLYNAQIGHQQTHLFELNGDGMLNIIGFTASRHDNPVLTEGPAENLHITAGYYLSEPVIPEDIGTFRYVHLRKTRHSVPKNANFAPNSELVTAESFDSYDFTNDSVYLPDDANSTTVYRGAVRIRLKSNTLAAGFSTGQDRYKEKPFTLSGGNKNDLYRMEWRFCVDEMRDTELSEIYLYLSNQDAKTDDVLTLKKDGALTDGNGNVFATIDFGTDYRLAVEIDARNAANKQQTVYLLNDASEVIARSNTVVMRDIFQNDNAVCGFRLTAIADPGEAAKTETDMQVDYFYVTRSEESTFPLTLGDVDGNGTVNSTDARLVLQYAVKKIGSTALDLGSADVNGDGKVDSTDARLVLQYAVKKITKFPISA